MKRYFKFSKIEIFLAIGFIVSTFAFALTISTAYSKYNKVTEKNKFNEDYGYIETSIQRDVKYIDGVEYVIEGEPVTLREIINGIKSTGYEKIILEPTMSNILIGELNYINKIWPCSSGINMLDGKIIKGRYLTEEELMKGDKVAVINEEIEKITTSKADGDYIEIFDEEYKVVGVYGNTEYLRYSTVIPLNSLNYLDKEIGRANFLEYSNENKDIKEHNGDKFNISVSEIQPTSVINYLRENVYELKGSIYQIVLGLVNLLLFSYFLAKGIKKKVAIMRVLGATNSIIFQEVFKLLIKISSIGIIIGLPIAGVTINFLKATFTHQYTEMNFPIALVTTTIILLLTTIVTFIVLFNVIRFKIVKEIR
ncbi:MAG: hypothetical protein ACRC7N_17480 [Clostridium sp.]